MKRFKAIITEVFYLDAEDFQQARFAASLSQKGTPEERYVEVLCEEDGKFVCGNCNGVGSIVESEHEALPKTWKTCPFCGGKGKR